MQKKKKYYEIKDGGVTLYWDMTANMLVDIDVQPGVKTVNLFVEKTASQYLYSMYKIMLDNVYKQFPDVEELHIGDDISTVKIRNDMFPNVKLVTSENDRFVDGASSISFFIIFYLLNRKAFCHLLYIYIYSIPDFPAYTNFYRVFIGRQKKEQAGFACSFSQI